jgi:hypothetical protein
MDKKEQEDLERILIKYQCDLEEEKKKLEHYPVIQTGKTPKENMNINLFPQLSTIDKDLQIPFISLIGELDCTNEMIVDFCDAWKIMRENGDLVKLYNTYYFTRSVKLGSYIIADIRHYIDMSIAITWYLWSGRKNSNIKIDSIGKYLSKKNDRFKEYDQFKSFMNLVNAISNAYKHSIPNLHLNIVGRDEPCLFTLASKGNKDIFHPQFLGVALSELIFEFNHYFNYSIDEITKVSNQN